MTKCYKLLIVLVLSSGAWAQNGEVSNGGFETWTDVDLYDFTTEWMTSNEDEYQGVATVSQSTDAQEGTYAVDLLSVAVGSGQNIDTLFGYVFHGQIGPSGPDGGIAYGDTFDEVRVQYKSSMVTGDTAMMIMMRFSGGTMIEMNTIPFATSSQANWTDASISVSNTGQDSLFIGFIMGNPFTENFAAPGSWVRVDNVRLLNGGTEVSDLPDPSFELWDSESVQEPNDWFTMNQFLFGLGAENATQTTDAFAGNYALELVTQEDPFGSDTLQGFISAGPINFFGMNPFSPIPYAASPTTFSGAYKYNQVNGDVARIQVTFFESGNIIGGHVENITATFTVWQTFSAPLSLSATPD